MHILPRPLLRYGIILLATLLSAAGFSAGHLRIAMSSEAPSLDIHVTSSSVMYHYQMYATLVSRSPDDGEFVGYLAKNWEVLDGGKRIRFWLRDDVVFHDGTPLNAEAVRYTYERLLDPERAAPAVGNAGPMLGAEVVDEFVVDVVYEEPYAPALLNMSNSYFGIISPTAAEEMGEDFSHHPISAGPFKFKERVAGDRVVLERFEAYNWPPAFFENQGPAYLETITYQFIPDDATQLLMLQTDGIDVASAPPRDVIRLLESGELGEGDDAPLQLYSYIYQGVTYIGLTTLDSRITGNQSVRTAIAHAVNREEIVDAALEGLAEPLTGLFSPATWGYDEDMVGYEFDIEAAQAVLEGDGFTMGADGFYKKDGEKLTIVLWTYNTPQSLRVSQIVQAQLADVGIDLQIQQLESATLLGSTQRGEHDALLISYGWADAGILSYFFGSDRIETTNRVHFSDAEVDELLHLGNVTVDVEERFKVYQDLQTRVLELAPWVPLYATHEQYIARGEVEGLRANLYTATLLFHDVYIGTKE